jgi:hypothetical protein
MTAPYGHRRRLTRALCVRRRASQPGGWYPAVADYRWEVLYWLGDRLHRVHPPGSWPAETWEQDLLGYPSRERDMSVAAVVFTCQPKIAAAFEITNGPCVPAPGKRQRLVSVHRQQRGDRPEAGAWADVKRTGEAMLARFSDDYRAALASLRSGQQDPPGKLTEFAIRWMEVTNWPSSLPARLSGDFRGRARVRG